MRFRVPAAACAIVVVLALPGAARAQLAASTFATDTEGWLSVTLPYPSALPVSILGTFAPAWQSGHIVIADPDGSSSTGNTEYWQAPAKFLGDQSAVYGDSLAFDIYDTGGGYGTFSQEDLILVGGGITVTRNLGSTMGSTWTHYAVPLAEATWHRDSASGPVPTQAEFKTVLGALTQLFIRAEVQLGPDTEYLDNVMYVARTTGVASGAPAAALALSPPAPNPSAHAARVEFSLPAAARAQVAVFDAGGRRVALLASGAFAAGPHAAVWDGLDAGGRTARAGLYWVRLTSSGRSVTRKLLRIE